MCRRAQQERVTRAEEIVAKLNSLGVAVDFDDAIAEAGDAASVGRPHIAKAAGLKPDGMSAFFEEYLLPGARPFVSPAWPTASEATGLIREAGGTPVLAHHFWDIDDPGAVAALIGDLDLDGSKCLPPSPRPRADAFPARGLLERPRGPRAPRIFHGPGHKMFDRFGCYPTHRPAASSELPRRLA